MHKISSLFWLISIKYFLTLRSLASDLLYYKIRQLKSIWQQFFMIFFFTSNLELSNLYNFKGHQSTEIYSIVINKWIKAENYMERMNSSLSEIISSTLQEHGKKLNKNLESMKDPNNYTPFSALLFSYFDSHLCFQTWSEQIQSDIPCMWQ